MNNFQNYLGIVKRDVGKLKFFVIDPPLVKDKSLFLTQIAQHVAVSPESRSVRLEEYEDKVILVTGIPNSSSIPDMLWNASVVEVAGPILTKVVKKIYEK